MNVILLDHTTNPVEAIGRMAAICYDAKTDADSNRKRAAHCRDKGHLATLRFAYATFAVDGISRVCSHQLVRIAHAGILQESQRYVEQSHVDWIDPPSLQRMPLWLQNEVESLKTKSANIYGLLVNEGMKKEDARYFLLQQCSTRLILCLNFQAWQDFLKNRTSKTAQWEIREVALEIHRQLTEIAPEIFG